MVVFKKEFEDKLKKQREQNSYSAAKTALERSAAKQVQSSQKAAASAVVLPGTDSRFSLPGTTGLLQTARAETVQSLLPEREIRSPMQLLSQSPGVQTLQSVSRQQMTDQVSTDFQSTNRLSGLPSIDSLRRRPDVAKFGTQEGAMEAEPERMLEQFVRQYNQQESRPYTITVDDKGRYSLEAVGDYEAEKKQIASDLSSLSGQIALIRQKFDTESRERLAELLERSEQLRTRQSELEAFPSEYYTLENVLQQFNLTKDPEAVKLYREAEEAQRQLAQLDLALELLHNPEPLEDRDPWAVAAEVMKAHGLTEQDLTDNGAEVTRVHEQLTDHLTDLEQQLQTQGFDFARMSGYQQKLAEDEAAQQTQTEQARFAKEHPVASTLASVLRSPLQGVEFVGKAVEQIGNDPDDPATYVPPSTADMLNTNFVNTVRGAVSEEIAQAYDWELFGQNVAAFLYQTGLSAVDSAATVGVLGPAATVVLGGSAAASTTADIINRGGTSEQAILGGLAAGVAEGLFEKVSIDNLLKPGDVVNVRTWAREVVKQSGIEASEEAMTEIANILSDSIIMGQNSSFSQLVAAYEAQGLSKEEAKQKALLDNIGQVAWAATGGALAGGMTGSVYRAVQGVQQSQASKAQLDAVGEAVRAANQTQDEIRKAQLLQVDGAADLAARQVTGGKISNRELGELTVANQAAAEQLVHTALESPDPAVRSLATQMLTSEGEAVTLRPVRSETVAALQAAMDGPAATQSDATAATETTPKMNTLDSITTGFTDMGMKLSTAEKKAAVMQKLMAGDTVTDKELATIDPTNKQVQALFSQLTGVTFPERGTSVETLRQLFRSAPEVMARQAETVVAEQQTEAVPDFQTWQTQNPVTESQKAQAREILAREMGDLTSDGRPTVRYAEFASRYRQNQPNATDAEVARRYHQFLEDEQTIAFGGRRVNFNQFRKQIREEAPFGHVVEESELRDMFNGLKSGNMDFLDVVQYTLERNRQRTGQRAGEAIEQERRIKVERTVEYLKGVLSKKGVRDIVLEDITAPGSNLRANAYVKNGVIHLNSSVVTSEDLVYRYVGHELTHMAKDSFGNGIVTDILNTFKELESKDLIQDKNISRRVRNMDAELEDIRGIYARAESGAEGDWTAEEELAGDLLGSVFHYPQIVDALVMEKPGLAARILDLLRSLIQRFRKHGQNEALDILEGLGKRFSSALEETARRDLEEGNAVDLDTEVYYSIEFDQQFMDNADQKNNGMVPQAVMEQARQDREKIAAYLNEFRSELQLPPDVMGNTWSGNSSYDGSEENTTVCIRTLAADALMDAIAEKVERPLTVQDTLLISQELFNFTDKPECLYCYVAMDRKNYREMMGRYIQQRDAALADLRSGMPYDEAYEKFLMGRKNTKPMRDRFKMWSEAGELISLSDLASPKRMAEATAKSTSFAKQIQDAHEYSFAATHAKPRVDFAAYDNHILNWTQRRVNTLNSHYGMRMYSFSDYSPAFILEDMQRVTDAAVRGLKGLAYTKELDFVRIFAPSGMNINVSVFGYDDGNGGVAQDGMQGADWAETQALREQFPNVGATFVATNDAQVEWALEQDWIDVIIPFHIGRTGAEVAAYFGWTNYKHMSDDVKRVKDGWTKGRDAKSIYPQEHQNNKEMYLAACEDNHLTPRFEKWVDHPNYMKLVNETRMAEAASQPLQPVFNTEAAMESLERMKKQGGYYVPVGGSVEEMLGIAEEIAEKLPKDVRYSLSTEVNSGGKRLTVEQAEFFRDSKVRDAEGRLLVMYHGTANGGPFTVFNPEKLSLSSRTSQQGPGFYFTNVQRWAREYTKDVDIFTGKARKGVAPNLFKTYLNITNPLELQRGVRTLTDEQVSALIRSSTYEWARGYWKWQLLDDKTVSDETAYAAFVDRARKWDDKNVVSELVQWFNSGTELLNAMQAITGYDGIHEHVRAGEQEGEIYVAFSPEQIKNVDNKMPTSDPDIRYSLSEETDSTGAPLTIGQASFFEASKARDDQGHLVRLYHGTGADFTVFDMSRAGKNFPNRGGDLGAYFTPFWDTAHGYATNFSEEGRVETVYLNLKNPLIVEDDGWGSAIAQIDTRSSDLRRWALSGGHDGIIVRSLDYEMDDAGTPDTVYVAFSPEQIKRIDNLTPTADPDIRYSISDELSFDEQVRQTLHGGLQLEGVGENPSALYVMKEPTALLQEVGFGDYPLVITQNHVQAITAQRWDENGQILPGADHNHQISEELFTRLPELIQSDVAAILKADPRGERTRGSVILLTTQTDAQGNPIVIALRPNGVKVTYDGVEGPAHIVTSVYGRENFQQWLENQAKHSTILYVNEKKAHAVPVSTFGASFASWYAGINPQGFDTIIGQRDTTVNRENAGKRRYSLAPEFQEWFLEQEGGTVVNEARVQRALERKDRQIAETKATAKQRGREKDLAWTIYSEKELRRQSQKLRNEQKQKLTQAREDKLKAVAAEKAIAKVEKDIAVDETGLGWQMGHLREMRLIREQAKAEKVAAVREAKEQAKADQKLEREIAKVEKDLQHRGDQMAEKRMAAERLHVRENAYQRDQERKLDNEKLRRNRARAALKDKKRSDAIRDREEKLQGPLDIVIQNPQARQELNALESAAEKLRTLNRSVHRGFLTDIYDLERMGNRQEGLRVDTLATVYRGASTTVETLYKIGLVDRSGNRIGDSMQDVFLVKNDKGKPDADKQSLLQTYLLHRHNIDRMSLVARAVEQLESFEAEHPWLAEMPNQEFARLVALTDSEAQNLGKLEPRALAREYHRLLQRVNQARNKPIFGDRNGDPVSVESSREIVRQMEEDSSWLKDKAQGIYDWWDQFMRTWAVGDSLSLEQYEQMKELYPSYVPTYRVDKELSKSIGFVGAGGASVKSAVQRAKGAMTEVLPIEDSFANIAQKIVRQARLNEVYLNIIDTFKLDEDQVFGDFGFYDWSQEQELSDGGDIRDMLNTEHEPATPSPVETLPDGTYKLTAWDNGKQVSAQISKDLYASIYHLSGQDSKHWFYSGAIKLGNKLTGPMKTAITGVNPSFAARNVFRDFPTAVVNSISGLAFPKYYAQAALDMAAAGALSKNSLRGVLSHVNADTSKLQGRADRWNQFKALGGVHSGYYNNESGFAKQMSTSSHAGQRALGALGAFNEASEAITRFAEYLATIERLGDTYENRLQGIKNAAEVTVDFGRHGSVGKVLNAWIPYWNPSVQGTSRLLRGIAQGPDGKFHFGNALKKVGRAGMTVVLPGVLIQALVHALGREDEWEQFDDRTKDTYYLIPLKDHQWLKIPKNREWGTILGAPLMRMWESANGRDDAFKTYLETSFIPNFVPGGPLDIIGVSQIRDLLTNEDFTGRRIIPYGLDQGSGGEQWDGDTSLPAVWFSDLWNRAAGDWLTELVGVELSASPMEVDYLLGDYFGDFADIFRQWTSVSTWSGDDPVRSMADAAMSTVTTPWIANELRSNQAVSDYYDLLDRLAKEVQDAATEDSRNGTELKEQSVAYQAQKAIQKLYGDRITKLYESVNGTPDEAEQNAYRAEIAALAGEALRYYEDIQSGKIQHPVLEANYADLPGDVSDELIRLDGMTEDYSFLPITSVSKTYTVPGQKYHQYELTDDQRQQFKDLYMEVYGQAMSAQIQSTAYQQASDAAKAEMLEATRDTVLEQTKEQFFLELEAQGVSAVQKELPMELPVAVANELYRLDSYTADYSFAPTGSAGDTFADPRRSDKEYVLTAEQKLQYKAIYQEVYGELMAELMAKSRYKSAKDAKKAALLEEERDKVLEETKDRFYDWLRETGAEPVEKE